MDEPQIRATGIGEGAAPAHFGVGNESLQSAEQKFLEHFGLSEQPFGVTPDPRFLYLGSKHRQALAALNYGTASNRGFLTLIAPPGMGKTSLLYSYLEGLRDKARTVFLFQTDGDSRELMSYILADLGLDGTGKDLPEMHAILNRVLTEEMHSRRRFVLVIDEAQNLTERVLESVRQLSNFETPWMKLMQIVLAGQPQLAEKLAKPSMAQLRQRISFAIRIEPLTSEEVTAYVDHRLWVAGYKGTSPFSIGARTLLAEHSEGIPRNINNMCFCAMSLGWATKQKNIDREMMRDVLAEMGLESPKAKTDFTAKPVSQPKQTAVQNLRPPVLMDLESPKPKTDFAPKPVRQPKQTVVQNLRPVVLTVKEPPARSWLPGFALACALVFALGWSAMHLDIAKRFTGLWEGISAAEKSPVVATPAPASFDAPVPDSPGNFSPGAASEAPTDDKNLGGLHQGGVRSTPSSREPN
jgi:general secretion pathway protein A